MTGPLALGFVKCCQKQFNGPLGLAIELFLITLHLHKDLICLGLFGIQGPVRHSNSRLEENAVWRLTTQRDREDRGERRSEKFSQTGLYKSPV